MWTCVSRSLRLMSKVVGLLTVSASVVLSGGAIADSNTITTTVIVNNNDRYALSMIKLALSHLDKPYQLKSMSGEGRTGARIINSVMNGEVDVMWVATNEEMEDQLLPVRIPLFKGLLGHRIFIIHRDDQAKFDRVKTFADLQKLSFGQGTTWADTQILESNQLKVVRANKYHSLLHMVDGGRFDAFPRGVQEPWSEVVENKGLDLAVEKRLMLIYRMPFYLFVNKNNKQLAADLELGLNRAIADGSFDKLFFNDPMVQDVLLKADLKNRLVFELQNPTLPKETPVNRPELWLDLNSL